MDADKSTSVVPHAPPPQSIRRLGKHVPSGLKDEIAKLLGHRGADQNHRKRLIDRCKAYDDGLSAVSDARRNCYAYAHLSGIGQFLSELDEAIKTWQPPRALERQWWQFWKLLTSDESGTNAKKTPVAQPSHEETTNDDALKVVLIAEFTPPNFGGFIDGVLSKTGVTRADFPTNWNIQRNLVMFQVGTVEHWDNNKCSSEIKGAASKAWGKSIMDETRYNMKIVKYNDRFVGGGVIGYFRKNEHSGSEN